MITILAAILYAATARSEDGTLPDDMLGFLRPGMHVGIQTVDGTTNVLLNVYSDEQYKIARDLAGQSGRRIAATTFADDHRAVRVKLDSFVEELARSSPDANSENILMFPMHRMSLGSITAIGKDYVLIDRAGETRRRLVLAKSSISRMDLDADPVRFLHPTVR